MEHTKLHNIPGILLLLDFRKAFDTIEWSFIQNTLNFLNFGDGIKRWVSTFYTGPESAVLNNGFSTNYFELSRGVRQGCPLSISQFADDTSLICKSCHSVEKAKWKC